MGLNRQVPPPPIQSPELLKANKGVRAEERSREGGRFPSCSADGGRVSLGTGMAIPWFEPVKLVLLSFVSWKTFGLWKERPGFYHCPN